MSEQQPSDLPDPARPAERHGPATLRGVAARAGVSKSVVSRVLQDSPHVSDKSRRAVQDAIKELGYRPNGMARSLSKRRTHAIGVLVNDLRQPWFADFLEGLNPTLHEHGLHELIGDRRVHRGSDERLLQVFMEMRFDGLVLAGTMPPSGTLLEAVRWLPTVVAGSRDFDLSFGDMVVQDDVLGAELALDHLRDLGHRRIHYISEQLGRVNQIRRASYQAWMDRHGLSEHTKVVACDGSEESGYLAAASLLDDDRKRRPTAIFVDGDLPCVGALAAARERHLDVPSDLSLIGYDNSNLARMRLTRLTSVDVSALQVGASAAAHLIERIADPSISPREHLIRPSLAVRDSTARAPDPYQG